MSRSEHYFRELDQEYGRIEDRRKERIMKSEAITAKKLDEVGDSLHDAVTKACAEIDRLRELNNELLEVLQEAIKQLVIYGGSPFNPPVNECLNRARRAILKAGGAL